MARREKRQQLAEIQVRRAEEIPLAPLSIKPVDIQKSRDPKYARDPCEWTVGHVADQADIGIAPDQVQHREERVKNRIKIFAVQAGENHAADTRVEIVAVRYECATTINRYLVSAVTQARGELLRKRLEAAVSSGDSPSAKDCNLHSTHWVLGNWIRSPR